MQKVIITRGLQASGKSTFAKELVNKNPNDWVRINKDDIRAMMGTKHSDKTEQIVLGIRNAAIGYALQAKKNVIIDDTNFGGKHISTITQVAHGAIGPNNVEVEVKDFPISLREAILRDAKRPNGVGPKVIYKTWKQYVRQNPPEYDFELPDAIICDLDGSLCLFGDNSPYDRDFSHDIPNTIIEYFLVSQPPRVKIILLSGRKDSFRDVTEEWLTNNRIRYDELHMRDSRDSRNDYIIKKELYEKYVKGKYNVVLVLDDRDRVVDLWRELGLVCFQVAWGGF